METAFIIEKESYDFEYLLVQMYRGALLLKGNDSLAAKYIVTGYGSLEYSNETAQIRWNHVIIHEKLVRMYDGIKGLSAYFSMKAS